MGLAEAPSAPLLPPSAAIAAYAATVASAVRASIVCSLHLGRRLVWAHVRVAAALPEAARQTALRFFFSNSSWLLELRCTRYRIPKERGAEGELPGTQE